MIAASDCAQLLRGSGILRARLQPFVAVIRVFDEVRNVIETHEHKGEFKDP
jgi:hypothetical protein